MMQEREIGRFPLKWDGVLIVTTRRLRIVRGGSKRQVLLQNLEDAKPAERTISLHVAGRKAALSLPFEAHSDRNAALQAIHGQLSE